MQQYSTLYYAVCTLIHPLADTGVSSFLHLGLYTGILAVTLWNICRGNTSVYCFIQAEVKWYSYCEVSTHRASHGHHHTPPTYHYNH